MQDSTTNMTVENDAFWREVRNFVQQHLQPEDFLLAPTKFKDAATHFSSYEATYSHKVQDFDWIVLHKGLLGKLNRNFLRHTVEQSLPVFANEVFVVLTNRSEQALQLLSASVDPRHLKPLFSVLDPRDRLNPPTRSSHSGLQKRISRWLGNNTDLQSSQLEAILNCLDRNTSQLERLLKTTQRLEKTVQQLQFEVRTLKQQNRSRRKQPIATLSQQSFKATCRAVCQTAYLGNDTILCRVLGRFFLYADSQDIGIVPHLCADGFWETWMTLAVAQVLQPGWKCIDVGANHGYYTLLMAEVIGKTGQILALEPNPKLANLLQRTVDMNGFSTFTTVLAKAAIDQPGDPINLVIPQGRGMNASVLRGVSPTDEVVAVETTSIDALTQDWEQVDLIKIDAEGAEVLIWQGLQQTIKRHPRIIIVLEFNAGRYPNPQAFLEAILAAGFALQHIDFDAEIKPLTIEQCLTERYHQDWLLFLQQPDLQQPLLQKQPQGVASSS